jgi:hypothetical protein
MVLIRDLPFPVSAKHKTKSQAVQQTAAATWPCVPQSTPNITSESPDHHSRRRHHRSMACILRRPPFDECLRLGELGTSELFRGRLVHCATKYSWITINTTPAETCATRPYVSSSVRRDTFWASVRSTNWYGQPIFACDSLRSARLPKKRLGRDGCTSGFLFGI